MNHKIFTVLLTGLSGAGKTTIATNLSKYFEKIGIEHEILDGTELRPKLSPDLGYSQEERETHRKKIIFVAELLTKHGIVCITPLISSTGYIRDYIKSKLENVLEIYLKCPLEIRAERDPQGHYKKIKEGKMNNFVGVDISYEEPENPDLVLETDKLSLDECINKIIEKIKELNYLD